MNAVVFVHVPVSELPPAWRAKLAPTGPGQTEARVTVRIETEAASPEPIAETFVTDDPAFGIWRDREDMADVQAYLQRLRAPRFNRDGSRNDPA